MDLISCEALGPLSSEQAEAMDSMINASQRLKQLIEDMLRFSNVAKGNLPVALAPVSLVGPVHIAVHEMQPKAKAKQVELRVRLAPQIPTVRADEEKISWVIHQLLDNAIKFTPTGGLVMVQAEHTEDNVKVSVKDNGIGIPKERLSEIFEPFHQLDGSTTRHHGGTGLGLALAQSIMEAHQSSIVIHSRANQGSCFSFSLPIDTCEAH